jgi:hypothetical protein
MLKLSSFLRGWWVLFNLYQAADGEKDLLYSIVTPWSKCFIVLKCHCSPFHPVTHCVDIFVTWQLLPILKQLQSFDAPDWDASLHWCKISHCPCNCDWTPYTRRSSDSDSEHSNTILNTCLSRGPQQRRNPHLPWGRSEQQKRRTLVH